MTDEPEPNEARVAKILATLKDHEARLAALEGRSLTPLAKKEKPISVREFILIKEPSDDTKKTLAIGYFLENFEGLASFNIRDLEEGFRRAMERVPLNINDKVNGNIRKGYMMAAPELKDGLTAWTLTNTGTRLVEGDFQVAE